MKFTLVNGNDNEVRTLSLMVPAAQHIAPAQVLGDRVVI